MPNQPERCCNKLVNARINKKKLKILRTRLKSVQKSVDNAPPASFGLPHLSCNLKKAQMLEDEYQMIESRNRTLLGRMSKIADNPSLTTDNHNNYQKHLRSLNYSNRRANRERVLVHNGHLLASLQSAQPYYRAKEWERDYQRSAKIMKHMMEHEYVAPKPARKVPKGQLLPDEHAPRAGPGFTRGGASSSPKRRPLKAKSSPKQQRRSISPSKRGRGNAGRGRGRGAGGSSPSRQKKQKDSKTKHKNAQAKKISVDDEVVEIFRFPSLVLPGADAQVRDSTWTISLYDTMASAEDNNDGSSSKVSSSSSVLVLRGIKLSGNHMAVLPVRMATLKRVVALADDGDSTIGGGGGDGEDYPDEFSEAGQLQEVFERMQDGVRAYRALGLLRGDTRLATQLANRLLTRLRVTKDMKLVVHFEESESAKIAASLDEVATGANRGVEILEAEEQAEAATRIQAVVRGKQARRSQANSDADGTTIGSSTLEGEEPVSAHESKSEDGSGAPGVVSKESRADEGSGVATTSASNDESNLAVPLKTEEEEASGADVNRAEAEPAPLGVPEAKREPDAANETPLSATSESVSEQGNSTNDVASAEVTATTGDAGEVAADDATGGVAAADDTAVATADESDITPVADEAR